MQALALLPDGGTIQVGAGVYTFEMPVVLGAPSLHIQGSGAVLHASNDGLAGVFSISGDGISVTGLEFHQDTPSNGQAVVRVTGSSFRLADCSFVGGDASGLFPAYLEFAGDPTENVIREVWVERTSFRPQAGWTAVRGREVEGVHFVGNSVRGEVPGGTPIEVGFSLLNVAYGEIAGNSFLWLGTVDAPAEAIILCENQAVEGHHLLISGNSFHTLTAKRAIYLRGSRFNTVTGNSIGRMIGNATIAALEIDANSTGQESVVTSIAGNDFHNAATAPMIRINGGTTYQLEGNQFSVLSDTCILVGDTRAAYGVSVLGNALHASTTPPTSPAVRIQGGSGHAVLGNLFRGFPAPAVVVTGVPSGASLVSSNFEF